MFLPCLFYYVCVYVGEAGVLPIDFFFLAAAFGQRFVFNYSPWSTRLSLLVSLWFVHTYFVIHGGQGANPADVIAYSTHKGNNIWETLETGWTLYLCLCCLSIKQKQKRSNIWCSVRKQSPEGSKLNAVWSFHVVSFPGALFNFYFPKVISFFMFPVFDTILFVLTAFFSIGAGGKSVLWCFGKKHIQLGN